MKTKFLQLTIFLFSFYSFSQKTLNTSQWFGPLDTTSDIFRTGKIAVGTFNPLSTFHVNGGLRITGTSPNNGGPTLTFGQSRNPSAEYGNYVIEYIPNEGLNFAIPWPNSGFGNYNLFLSTSRRVGIGTNNVNCSNCSGYKLFVKDGIKTEKVKVEIANVNGWADYVFEKDYDLMPLKELQSFIKRNKRLPEVPSATEAVSNGIELKEMNVLLLKKVEELTLHILKLNERIEKLEKNK
jgi:predicted RNA-binding protein with TRAM domain